MQTVVGLTTTQTRMAREQLREAILGGRLRPGQRLRAATLAAELGTSRTPVREALLQLEREGLVEMEPRRGARVGRFSPEDLLDLYEVRALIEPHAAARAASRVAPREIARLERLCRLAEEEGADDDEAVDRQIAWNQELHGIVLEASESPRLVAAARTVSDIPRSFRAAFWVSDEQRRTSLACHRDLVAALRAGSPGRAEAVMRAHILGARDYLVEVMDDARTA